MAASKSVYLDVCALSRPFDDQQQARIRLETEAVKLILAHVRQGSVIAIISPVHELEVAAIPDSEEREQLMELIYQFGHAPAWDFASARLTAESLVTRKFGVADAAHIAFAEQARADFVSVDDRLLKNCHRTAIRIWCGSPVAYCEKEQLR